MKELMRRIRADYMLSSLLCIAMGIVFIANPDSVSSVIGTVCAVVLIVIGVVYLGSYFLHVVTGGISAAMGAVVLLLGVWVLLQPQIVTTLVPIVIGVVLLAHGFRGFRESLATRKFGSDAWGIGAVLAVISMVLGVVCIVDAFGVVNLAIKLIGVALIYNGVSNIYIAIASSRSERRYSKNHETIDVEFNEDK
jgi:predicted phage tail protein